jgi:hypothetical protein
MTGWEGRGGGGGEYDWECLFDDNRDDNKCNNDNKYDNAENEKGLRGGAENGGNSTTTVVTTSAGHLSGV